MAAPSNPDNTLEQAAQLELPELHELSFNESHQRFKRRLLISILIIAAVFATIFGALHYADINPLNDFHANVNFVYAFSSLMIAISLRADSKHFQLRVLLFLIISHLTFTSAFINVADDQFRAIWFYLLVLVAYILSDARTGLLFALAALVTMLMAYLFLPLNINAVSFKSIMIGLIVMGIISQVFTNRVRAYVDLLNDKNEQLFELAKLDPLTGILNSRCFHEFGQKLFSIAQRSHNQLAILYIDLDHFKRVNDVHGHDAGDLVLKKVSDIIQHSLRDSDLFSRIGGEEFCILLPQTTNAGALELAHKIRALVEESVMTYEGKSIKVTSSIGIASLKPGDHSLKDLQIRADKNLYSAKVSGRNQVVNDQS